MVVSGKASCKTSVKSRRQHDGSAHAPTPDARTKRVRVSDQDPDGFTNRQLDYVTRLVRAHLDQKSPVSVSYLMSTKMFEGFSVNRLKVLVQRVKREEKRRRDIDERQRARRAHEERAEEERMARERQAERERTSLVAAQLQRAEPMLSDNEKTIRSLETEIQESREKEGRLNDQLDLLRGDLASQDKDICNKEAEIQALENEITQLRTRHEQVPGDAVLIDKLQLELHHRQSALVDIQRMHLATANELKSKEAEYKLWVDAWERTNRAYEDLQARSSTDKIIVAAFRRSARVEKLIKTVMEDILRSKGCTASTDDYVMKKMRLAIVHEFGNQMQRFSVQSSRLSCAPESFGQLLEVWVKARNASAHEEDVIGRVDYGRYHTIMDALEAALKTMHQILSGHYLSADFGGICQLLVDTNYRACTDTLV